MTANSTPRRLAITRRHRDLLLVASVVTYLTVTLGGIVCITDSSRGCPDWPGCYGQLVPPLRGDSILEYAHRVMAALTTLFIVASAIAGWRKFRSSRWVSWPPALAAAFLLAVLAFGAMVVLRGLEPGLAALDLGSALIVLALMLAATVVASSLRGNASLPDRLSFRSPYAKLTVWTLVTVFIVLVSGVLVATSGSAVRCLGWPLYGGRLNLVDAHSWLQLSRRLLAVPASISVIAVVVQAWREPRQRGAIRITTTVVGVLFVIETMVGALMLVYGPAVALQVVYVATAAAFWGSLVALVVLAGLASPTPAEEGSVAKQARFLP